MKKIPLVRGLSQEIRINLREELRAWIEILRTNWVYASIAALFIGVFFIRFNPLPPTEVFLGTGQKGSSYRQLGTQFTTYFRNYGIELKTVDSRGLSEDLGRVIAPESPVSAGFYVAGSADPEKMSGVVSLGSIQFSPLWIFYRGQKIDALDGLPALLKRRVAVGNGRSSSHAVFERIAKLHGVDVNAANNLMEMPHMEAVEKLRNGEIDAMAILDSLDSPVIQSVLHEPNIHILDFKRASAYEKQLPFLHELVIPTGSLNLHRNEPDHDIHLLGTTVTLLVESDTHPVVQWIFLKAARHISNTRQQFFSEPGYFPVYLDRSLPLSKVAKRYYQDGLPALANHVPLWLADFIDRVWFYLLAGLTVLIPAFRTLVASRTYYSNQVIENAFIHLRDIDRRIAALGSTQAADELMAELENLSQTVEDTWIASNNIKALYSFKPRIKNVKDAIKEKRRVWEPPEEALND
jgi:TRAP-type uncharacterized transport system substrate-binding protein